MRRRKGSERRKKATCASVPYEEDMHIPYHIHIFVKCIYMIKYMIRFEIPYMRPLSLSVKKI